MNLDSAGGKRSKSPLKLNLQIRSYLWFNNLYPELRLISFELNLYTHFWIFFAESRNSKFLVPNYKSVLMKVMNVVSNFIGVVANYDGAPQNFNDVVQNFNGAPRNYKSVAQSLKFVVRNHNFVPLNFESVVQNKKNTCLY